MIMEFLMKPGIRMKRWIFLGFVGVVVLVLGFVEVFSNKYYNSTIRLLYLFLSFIVILTFSEFINDIKDLTNLENAIYIITIPSKLKNKYKSLIVLL